MCALTMGISRGDSAHSTPSVAPPLPRLEWDGSHHTDDHHQSAPPCHLGLLHRRVWAPLTALPPEWAAEKHARGQPFISPCPGGQGASWHAAQVLLGIQPLMGSTLRIDPMVGCCVVNPSAATSLPPCKWKEWRKEHRWEVCEFAAHWLQGDKATHGFHVEDRANGGMLCSQPICSHILATLQKERMGKGTQAGKFVNLKHTGVILTMQVVVEIM